VFEIAEQVDRWRSIGRQVTIARVLETVGLSSRERAAAVALSNGEPVAGSLLSGAMDDKLRAAVAARGASETGFVEQIPLSDDAAAVIGLSCGGTLRVLFQPAAEIPDAAWQDIARRSAVCLVTDMQGDEVGATRAFTTSTIGTLDEPQAAPIARLFNRGANETALMNIGDTCFVVTALWPTPQLLVLGDGLIAEALWATGNLLGWTTRNLSEADDACSALAVNDAVVVLSHDLDISGRALSAALASDAGYVGALGSRRTQAARAAWLQQRDVADNLIARIHGPAGLDIGARTPQEIAVSIIAEIMMARCGSTANSLRDRAGSIHLDGLNLDGLNAPPRPIP